MTTSTTSPTFGDLDRRTQLVMGALKLAMREFDSKTLTDQVQARCMELVNDPGFEDAENCHDCHVLLPFPVGPAYAIDSSTVCQPCAVVRYGDKAAEYLIA